VTLHLISLGFVLKKYKSEFQKFSLKFFFSFALRTCVNKVSHLCYWS